ncbi:MAG: UDP-N-acetylmuramoyl-tripeptide--D-alanyl-D-alanine ligase [Hyphomicrobium sp.]
MTAEHQATVLWTWQQLVDALFFADADGAPNRPLTGVSIDTRSLQPGDIFVALKDQRDGHEFVTSAFKAGAGAAIVGGHYVRHPGDGALLRCHVDFLRNLHPESPDTLRDCDPLMALETLGSLARRRLAPEARVIAVTGSAGKTGTKEMLRACLARIGNVHASEKSYNNHWGVPLTLARMPAETQYAVLEIGMNHAGEIAALVPMVRPHAAIITTVEAVHLEHFENEQAIADAKAEIFGGLVSGGAAIIKRDSVHFDRLRVRAQAEAARVVSFGLDDRADVYAEKLSLGEEGTGVTARIAGQAVSFHLAMPGRHVAENALAVVAALEAVGADLPEALAALATLAPPGGRGARSRLKVAGGEILLIDESYNANPASMRAALATLATVPRNKFPRRIAVLGDMLELGAASADLHRGLIDAVISASVDQLFVCGPHMKSLYDAASPVIKGGYCETSSGLQAVLTENLKPGDVVMVKGSNGMRLGPLVQALQTKLTGRAH